MKLKSPLIGLLFSIIVSHVYAETSTGNFQSTSTLNGSCTLTGGSLGFGAFQPQASGTTTARGTFSVLCTSTSAYDVIVSAGNSNNQQQRSMTGQESNDSLQYNIYTDTTYTTIVGDETGGTSHPMTGVVNGRSITNGISSGRSAYISIGRTVTWYLYGSLNNSQYVTPDNYMDNLTITLNY
jgi:spore coat protein U-like protein